MGGVGKLNKKYSKTPTLCTNLKELGVILRNLRNFLLKIVVWGGGNSWKLGGKFPEKWSWGETTIREGRVRYVNFGNLKISEETSLSMLATYTRPF